MIEKMNLNYMNYFNTMVWLIKFHKNIKILKVNNLKYWKISIKDFICRFVDIFWVWLLNYHTNLMIIIMLKLINMVKVY